MSVSTLRDALISGTVKFSSLDAYTENDHKLSASVRREYLVSHLPADEQDEMRQEFAENCPLDNAGCIYDKAFKRCCENVIGYSLVPIGMTPPILINGEALCIPLSTTEGALIASISRGGKAASLSGFLYHFST